MHAWQEIGGSKIGPTNLLTWTPPTRSRVLWKTETFFSEYGYRPHVSSVLGHRKRRFSNTFSRVGSIHRIHVDRRKRRFSNTMTSCLGSRLALPHIRFENGYMWTQIFLNTEKKNLRFRKYPVTCGRSNTNQKRYVWTQVIFKIRRKRSPFSKIPGYVWTRP